MNLYFKRINVALCGIIAMCLILAGCDSEVSSNVQRIYNTKHLSFKIFLTEEDRGSLPLSGGPIERRWISYNRWHPRPSSSYMNIEYIDTQSGESIGSVYRRSNKDALDVLWPESTYPGGRISLFCASDLGELTFDGELGCGDYANDVTAFGMVLIDLNETAVNQIRLAFKQELPLDAFITLIINDVNYERLMEFADCGVKFTLLQAARLTAYDFRADSIKKLVERGFNFDAEDIINLARNNVSADYVISWKQAGYDLSADKLVYARQRNLAPDTTVQWSEAGFKLTLEQLYWVKQRNINPREANQWKNAGYNLSLEELYWVKQRNMRPEQAQQWSKAGFKLTLEQLYWVKQRNINPQEANRWKDAGYALSLEELYWVKQRNLHTNEASKWKQMGYDFSIKELYQLKQYNIQPSYGETFIDPEFELPGAEKLIEFKRLNIPPDTIKTLRKRKAQ